MNNSLDTLYQILDNDNISSFKYCLVNENKLPFTLSETIARPNHIEDFFSIDDITNLSVFEKYVGIGISIQGSNICAIDVDKCFSRPFDLTSIDERGNDIIQLFKDKAYIEFSFSGTGLRILFQANVPENYSQKYYTKNSKNHIEFYHPKGSFRYVTLTGRYIFNNEVINSKFNLETTLIEFLNIYMLKQIKEKEVKINQNDNVDCKKELKKLIRKDFSFQEIWFSQAPGSGSNESELDYFLIKSLYDNITNDKDKIKEMFESSPYFNSKDNKHIKKWEQGNGRYYDYIYEHL